LPQVVASFNLGLKLANAFGVFEIGRYVKWKESELLVLE
jgi:hypothetical protein